MMTKNSVYKKNEPFEISLSLENLELENCSISRYSNKINLTLTLRECNSKEDDKHLELEQSNPLDKMSQALSRLENSHTIYYDENDEKIKTKEGAVIGTIEFFQQYPFIFEILNISDEDRVKIASRTLDIFSEKLFFESIKAYG